MNSQICFFLCILNLRFCHLVFHSCTRWNNQSVKMKKQIFLKNTCLPLLDDPFPIIIKTTISGDKLVACSTAITRREERNKPSGCTSSKKIECVMVLNNFDLSVNNSVQYMITRHFP